MSVKPRDDRKISRGLTGGQLRLSVRPVYPSIAKAAEIEDTVVLQAVIDEQGRVQEIFGPEGPPVAGARGACRREAVALPAPPSRRQSRPHDHPNQREVPSEVNPSWCDCQIPQPSFGRSELVLRRRARRARLAHY